MHQRSPRRRARCPDFDERHNIGYAINDWHNWGTCTLRDFKGGDFDWTIASNGHTVHNGMLWGWFDAGGAAGSLGCPTSDEHPYQNGVRQDFQGGSLYWGTGFDHAVLTTPQTDAALAWANGHLGQDYEAGRCLEFVAWAWAAARVDIGTSFSAATYADGHPGQLDKLTTPPRGAIVLWRGTPGFPDGHAALSIGGGYAISTDERTTRVVHVLSIADRNATGPYSSAYAGWLLP